MTAEEFIKKVDYESQSEAQIELIERQINDALLKAIASKEMPKIIWIQGLKKSSLTMKTKEVIISKGYKIGEHFIGCDPEAIRLIL